MRAIIYPHTKEFHMDRKVLSLPRTDRSLAAMKKSIQRWGQTAPIVMYGDEVLVGHLMLEACIELGIEPETVEFVGSAEEADQYVYDHKVGARKHWTTGQLAILA